MNPITEFQGEYRWLSNFYPAPVALDDETYPTVENAFQAAKANPKNRGSFRFCDPGEAKRLGKRLLRPHDWDDRKVAVMRGLIQQKFAPGTELAEKLLATGEAELIEGNTWGDIFWGVCRGLGENNLGRLLMEQRACLQAL